MEKDYARKKYNKNLKGKCSSKRSYFRSPRCIKKIRKSKSKKKRLLLKKKSLKSKKHCYYISLKTYKNGQISFRRTWA